jgi:hypothetical protein
MAEFNKIIEFIKYILKIFIYFDTKLVYIQNGGVAPIVALAAPIVVDAMANKMKDQGGTSNNNNNSENNNKEVENKEFLWIIKEIKEIVMSVLEWIGSKLLSLASMLLFASTAPILPFFISMAGMFGVLKFFMYKLRRL